MVNVADTLKLAVRFHQAGELAQAEAIYRQILETAPRHPAALHLLGVVAHQKGLHADAIASIRQAIEVEPRQAIFYSNLGEAYRALGQLSEAIDSFRHALRLQPNLAEAHNNLGLALAGHGEPDEAARHFDQSVQLQPQSVDARGNFARMLLLKGDLERGWQEYEWRMRVPRHPSQAFTIPQWDGSPLDRQRLFLYSEQGLGDTLQFIRYLPAVRERVANMVVAVQSELIPLLRQSGYEVVTDSMALPECHVQCSLLSLPKVFRTTLATIPAQVPYLQPDPRLVDNWRGKLAKIEGRKIGIAWQGNRAYRSDRLRSIPLSCFAPLASAPGVRLISLQKGDGVEQLTSIAAQFPVLRLDGPADAESGPFMDTAAIMTHLDLVVTSDTAIAHLAGALGVPVWVALPVGPDWRWLLNRTDSPWYPTMRLFRQTRFGEWSDVFQRMAELLAEGEF